MYVKFNHDIFLVKDSVEFKQKQHTVNLTERRHLRIISKTCWHKIYKICSRSCSTIQSFDPKNEEYPELLSETSRQAEEEGN